MFAHALHRSGWSLVAFATVAALAGCEDETALGPTAQPAIAACSLSAAAVPQVVRPQASQPGFQPTPNTSMSVRPQGIPR